VNGHEIRARRRAREIVADLRWQGIGVPPLYARMARQFQDLVDSGDYASWVAANQKPVQVAQRRRVGGIAVITRRSRSEDPRTTRHARPAPTGRATRRRHLLPGPALGR
jgi:hypothetical protein